MLNLALTFWKQNLDHRVNITVIFPGVVLFAILVLGVILLKSLVEQH